MDDLTKFAVSKAVSGVADGVVLPVGKYEVDSVITVRVKGTVNKAEDYFASPTSSIPIKATLALLLEKSGWSREMSKKLLLEAMNEAISNSSSSSESISNRVKDIEEAELHVKGIIGSLPKVKRSGPTTSNLSIEFLGDVVPAYEEKLQEAVSS